MSPISKHCLWWWDEDGTGWNYQMKDSSVMKTEENDLWGSVKKNNWQSKQTKTFNEKVANTKIEFDFPTGNWWDMNAGIKLISWISFISKWNYMF